MGTENLCGPECLLAICRYLGIDAELEGLAGLAGTDPEVGTAFGGLADAARAKGFGAEMLQVDAQEVRRIIEETNLPVIIHILGHHYVVLWEVTSDYFKITDTIWGSLKIAHERMSEIWEGVTLALSRGSCVS